MKRVLIVDDEEDLTWSIAKHLKKDSAKYELFTVNSGKEALDILSQVPVDLVLSDIRMPEISGMDLLLEIREKYPTTKVIIMTAYGSSEIQNEANARGCFRYIEKPFEMQDLRKLVMDGVQDKKGFEGRVSDFQISDLIQMTCLGRLTNALLVEKDRQKGSIFIEDGNITHCEMDDMEGEKAFYEIMSWEGGSFSVEKGMKSEKETILKGWQGLLIESMRLADEQRNKGISADDSERQLAIEKILKEYAKNQDVSLTALIDNSGISLASIINENHKTKFKVSDLFPVINSFIEFEQETMSNLGLQDMREMFVEFGDALLSFSRLPGRDEILAVLARKEMNLGLIRMENKKAIKKISLIIENKVTNNS